MITIVFLTVVDFVGRFHPVLVHLPIGILILSVIFYFLSIKQKYAVLQLAVKYSLLLGFLSALVSCGTGYLLSNSGDYNESVVFKHQWLGIATTIIAALIYFLFNRQKKYVKWLMPFLILFIIITGHLGGTLTHGEGYLTGGLNQNTNTAEIKPIKDVQQAAVYADIIQPILQTKCYSCHSTVKQKGKLRLDEPSLILKGGENGKAVIPGNISESELIKRILLPETNEDHMPPKSKPQLTQSQIDLLHWWVAQGADFNKKTAELNQPEKIKPVLVALQNNVVQSSQMQQNISLPEGTIDKAPENVLKQLAALNVAVSPVAQGSNYLQVSFAAADTVTVKHLELLQQIAKQIIWLKIGGTSINDDQLQIISKLTALTRLSLEKTAITDRGLTQLNTLISLGYLNLSFTKVTEHGLVKLTGLKQLKQLYLFGTPLTANGYTTFKKNFPDVKADTGGYKLEFLASDTVIVKATPKK